ncbi:MAG: alanine racemase, partial [Campylobacterota bacterium]|nr:alanine racemase [Campylobacterota bacterium]
MGFISLDKKAFFNNADFYSDLLGDKSKLCIALKDNAYGHGLEEMASLSLAYGINHTMVRNILEANIANKYNFETILILYENPKENYPTNYIFSINSIEYLQICPQNTPIELKIDTGMSRNGIMTSKIDEAIDIVKKRELKLNGVFTHFCCSDEENDSTTIQEKIFLDVIKQIKKKIKTPFRIHCANSSGVSKVNNSLYDIARIGIGLYGYTQTYKNNLKPVLSLYANKISTRELKVGDSIGYGATYKVIKDGKFSNYDIGYGDGFFRLNERKKAYISNKKEILGRVSMDGLTVEGDDDEICVFNDVTNLAKIHDTIEYEILTHLQPHIKRVIK